MHGEWVQSMVGELRPLVEPVWVQRVLSTQTYPLIRVSLVTQWPWICLPTQEMRVWSLGQEDPQEKEMETHSTILAWEIPWTEQPGGLQSVGSQKVGYNWVTNTVEGLEN